MENIEFILFLNDLEDELINDVERFEEDVRVEWDSLPVLESNTIYHICPYFDGIDNYFKMGLMRIADGACRKYQKFSGQSKELSWYAICNDYPEVIEELCTPYTDAFEAVSSKGMDRLRETKAKLERATSNRTHGYITNSLGFALAYETLNAISNALKSVENDNLAWKNATEPQRIIHNRLSNLWNNSFDSVFMKSISVENRKVILSIIESFCLSFGYSYEKYLAIKKTSKFADALRTHREEQEKQKRVQESSKQQQKKRYLESLTNEIEKIDLELSNIGFVFWGEKGAKKRELKKRREDLQLEIHAVENPIPVELKYTAYISHNTTSYDMLMKNFDKWYNNNCKEYWQFRYSQKHNDYIAYTPQNEPFFTVGQGFVQKYGRKRLIGAKFEGCPCDSGQRQVAELEYSLFEIDE